ncbi:MAG: diaminopimelate decarboxylase [Gammaproteobacteria bacterium]|nr:MAG: diaminopimelate decarboxylase [Gammaproteobacteria bacterium]
MSCLHYIDGNLCIENVKLAHVADTFGTPSYVYSRAMLENNWQAFNQAFQSMPHRICYAVKANSNIAILHLFARLNAGFDIVSMGELERVLAAGGDPKKIVFSGVGKKREEIEQAIKKGIYCFNVESEPELDRLAVIAQQLNTTVNITLRINPDVNPQTHAHISTGLKENKFGMEISHILPLCQRLSSLSSVRLIGIGCHIGSQMTRLDPVLTAIDCLIFLYQQLRERGIAIQTINIGGGLGIIYHRETPPTIADYAQAVQKKLSPYTLEVILEPGRAMVGNAGVLLTRVEYLKFTRHKNFAIVDAGMNDLLRPSLYNAWHDIQPVTLHSDEKKIYDIVGPVCESADFLGKNRELALHPNDLLAIDGTGAYGFGMSSNYNSRPRPAEILIDNHQMHLIRRRETIQEAIALEQIIME